MVFIFSIFVAKNRMNEEKAMKTQTPTFESVWAALQETDRIMKENNRFLTQKQAETDKMLQETDRLLKESKAETDRLLKESKAENDRLLKESKAETDRLLKESKAETDRLLTKLTESVQKLNVDVGGMGNSHGDFAEAYFFNSFENGRCAFFGEKFDEIEKNLKGIEAGYKAEYDIVLFNGKSVGIVEVKYKARIIHVDETIDKVITFRVNFPKYANHQIFLGLASFVFEPEVEKECFIKGIAVIKQVGDTVVIRDEHLRVF